MALCYLGLFNRQHICRVVWCLMFKKPNTAVFNPTVFGLETYHNISYQFYMNKKKTMGLVFAKITDKTVTKYDWISTSVKHNYYGPSTNVKAAHVYTELCLCSERLIGLTDNNFNH